MEDLIVKIKEYLPLFLQGLGGLVIFATAVAKATPNPKDDGMVDNVANKLFKVISYLPTVGMNPRTKKIEEAYKGMKEKKPDA